MRRRLHHAAADLRVDVDAIGVLAQHAAKAMVPRRQGRIIFTTSLTGLMGRATIHAYCASKAGLAGLTRSLAAELGEHGPASHRELGTLARALGVERLYTFGSLAALAAESFGAGAERYTDMDALVRAVGATLPGDVRLLVKGSRVNRLERLLTALAGAPAARQASR